MDRTIRIRRDSGGDAANLFGTFCPKGIRIDGYMRICYILL